MLKGWTLWKYFIKRAAKTYDILDPFLFLSRMQGFSEPSEVQEPIELLRAGILFHARGLINTKAIQHNLDWVWPYWVERQFDPNDVSFIPRAFSFSHVNLTHRNWTAVGLPEVPVYPIIDPRGMVTPFHDGWSLDFWLVSNDGEILLPSRLPAAEQHWLGEKDQILLTTCEKNAMRLASQAMMKVNMNKRIVLDINIRSQMPKNGWIVIAIRPYNPEGVQFIEKLAYYEDEQIIAVNGLKALHLSQPPEYVCFSDYRHGDVAQQLAVKRKDRSIYCETGMATGALLFPAGCGQETLVNCTIPIAEKSFSQKKVKTEKISRGWPEALDGTAEFVAPDARLQNLYNIAVRTVVQLTASEPMPGPFTYKRFWYRDACFMLNAILAVGLERRCLRLLAKFPKRQKKSGYYHSQNGEWDSNGQVLWIANRIQEHTGEDLSENLLGSLFSGAKWICRKRRQSSGRHTGLLPAGFSAEHFGPNDFYYWDDFWAVSGLFSAARLARLNDSEHQRFEEEAKNLYKAIIASLSASMQRRKQGGMPASPGRRMDAGAIGCLVADYPLQLFKKDHPWVHDTFSFLLDNCMQQGGFFQDIIHSGINPYLTLAMAQTLLRYGDDRYRQLIQTVAKLASPTGQWPEAIHPLTGGGCMGDGQHGWAAAEWILMIRSLFIREEKEQLIIGSGIFPEWLQGEKNVAFGPTPTPYGPVRVEILQDHKQVILNIHGRWRNKSPQLTIQIPGYNAKRWPSRSESFVLEPA